MALIKCPECGKEISDKSKQCIHCGYPLELLTEQSPKEKEVTVNHKDKIYDVVYDGYSDEKARQEKSVKLMAHIRKICNIGLAEAKKIVDTPPCTVMEGLTKENAEWFKKDLETFLCDVHIIESTLSNATIDNAKINTINPYSSSVICPKCGSDKITTGQRGYSFWTGFLGSNKTVNRCAKCGHSWQPH